MKVLSFCNNYYAVPSKDFLFISFCINYAHLYNNNQKEKKNSCMIIVSFTRSTVRPESWYYPLSHCAYRKLNCDAFMWQMSGCNSGADCWEKTTELRRFLYQWKLYRKIFSNSTLVVRYTLTFWHRPSLQLCQIIYRTDKIMKNKNTLKYAKGIQILDRQRGNCSISANQKYVFERALNSVPENVSVRQVSS